MLSEPSSPHWTKSGPLCPIKLRQPRININEILGVFKNLSYFLELEQRLDEIKKIWKAKPLLAIIPTTQN